MEASYSKEGREELGVEESSQKKKKKGVEERTVAIRQRDIAGYQAVAITRVLLTGDRRPTHAISTQMCGHDEVRSARMILHYMSLFWIRYA